MLYVLSMTSLYCTGTRSRRLLPPALLLALALLLPACAAASPDEPPALQVTPAPTPTSPPLPALQVTPAPTSTPPPLPALSLARVFPALDFQRATNLVQPPVPQRLWFLTEQSGRVWAVSGDTAAAKASLVLDIAGKVSRAHNEEGLLGLAFDPGYAASGYIYLYYSAANPRRNVLSRFTAAPAGLTADPASEIVVLQIPKPFGNHNGGQLTFGPDGFLYVSVGDGGGQGDPSGNGQNLGAFLGKILRLDVRNASLETPYRIPPDNPFVGREDARGEIWAYGLRNPWRFSFDQPTGLLWAADVGQSAWEEVDIIRKGGNYGWDVMEGAHCFTPPQGCATAGFELPVAEYGHAQGCSITGGHVYRGSAIPALAGAYLYADYCSGTLWGLRYEGGRVTQQAVLAQTALHIISFAFEPDGESYAVAEEGVFRLQE